MRLIDAGVLYAKVYELEKIARQRVHEKFQHCSDENGYIEWRVWNAVFNERAAFKQLIFDAPTEALSERKKGEWKRNITAERDAQLIFTKVYNCSECGYVRVGNNLKNYCPNCGADMRERKTDETD